MMEKTVKIKLFLLLSAFVAAVVFLSRVYMSATSPSSVKVMIYKIELMTDALDAKPKVVFSNAAGQEIDLTKDSGAVIGQAQIPAGTYKRIRMTVTNGIKLSIANAVDNPCGGAAFADRVTPIAGVGTNPNSQVQINFATYDDDGGTWASSRVTHFLLKPVTVSENYNTQMKFRVNTTYNLFCLKGTVEMRAPWSVQAETF